VTLWEARLRAAWADAASRSGQERRFRTQRLSPDLRLDVHAGLRFTDNALCLVIEAPAPAEAHFEAGGMRLSTAADDHGPLLVLSLEDSVRADLFTNVCADVVAAAAAAPQGEELSAFLARLDAWRRFLRDRRSGLARHEVVGLIGELTVLVDLLRRDSSALALWTAPDDGLQDFVRDGVAMEVKSTIGTATALRISRLDQLETTGLSRLILMHVLMVQTEGGETLRDLIARVLSLLPGDNEQRLFQNALLRRGLMPDDEEARVQPAILVRAIEAYQVADDFPRLTRSTVPGAISEAQYEIELRDIVGFRIDAPQTLADFVGGGA